MYTGKPDNHFLNGSLKDSGLKVMAFLNISFNQDSTCFACAKENGFIVYNCEPPVQRFARTSDESQPSGLAIVEMLFSSNIFALVGGGLNPKYPRNSLIIWDDFQSKCGAELEFKTPVTGVKIRRDMVLATIQNRAYLYSFPNLTQIAGYDTFPNPTGICALSSAEDSAVVAVPGNVLGSVVVENITSGMASGIKHVIAAHTNPIAAITLNKTGTHLATASDRGTLIRVWDVKTGNLIKELRRGLEAVTINCMKFDSDTTRLVVCSDKGTVHVFSLIEAIDNRKSNLSYISGYLPSYFSSEWSSVSFEVPPNSVCAFSSRSVDTIYVITPNGRFHRYIYDTALGTGKCVETKGL